MEIGKDESCTAKNCLPQRTKFQFSEPREPQIFFNSQFDSGNMAKVVRTGYDHYSIWTACDAEGTDNEGYPKSWFYFEVGGFCNRRVTFSIHRVHFLFAMVRDLLLSPKGTKCIDLPTAFATTTGKSAIGTDCHTLFKIYPSIKTMSWSLNSISCSIN